MSGKSRNPEKPYNKLTVGIAPDSWGVWFPEDDKQVNWQTFLDEVAEAGYEVIETGPFGFLPTDPEVLQAECTKRGIRVVAGTQFGILHRPEAWEQTEREMRANASVLKAIGAHHLVYLPPMLRDLQTGGWAEDPNLSDADWKLLAGNANRLGKLLKEDYDVTMVVHPHGDSHIENREQIDRFFAETDPEYVSFCLDTGHLEYGEVDTVDLIRRDGGTMRVTVVAKIASNQYLSSDLILDYDDNADLVAQDTVFRCFATAGRDDLRAALEAEGIGSATVMSRQGWVDEGIRGALTGQRQVLTMIFLVPCLLALAATALGVRAYAKVTQRSRRRMRLLGFTESDMRAEYLGEMLVQLTVIVAELVVVIGLSAWKVGRMAAAAGTDSPPVLDTTVTAVAGLVMLAALITTHLVHLHLILKEGRAHETL